MDRVLTVHHSQSLPNLEQLVHSNETQLERGLSVSLRMLSHLLPLVLSLQFNALLDVLYAGDVAIMTAVGVKYVQVCLI